MSSTGAATVAGRKRAGATKRRRPAKPAPVRKAKAKPKAAPAQPSLPWRVKLLALAALLGALAAGYFLWLRDSSLVAISQVEVTGVQSGDTERIVAELTSAAEQMTTLHLDSARLEEIGGRFPTVAAVTTDTDFPHGLKIHVSERPPRVAVQSGEERVALTADGIVLPGVQADEELPVLELDQVPAAGRLGGEPLEQALVAGAAPKELAPLIERVAYDDELGVEVELRGGIPVRFGTAARAREKWAAAAAVLADPKLDGLTYLDVRVPERPSTGG